MNRNLAYIVVGAESTGTRLVTRLLIAAGCYGDPGEHQRLDTEIPNDGRPLVWRRSIPHGEHWPDITDLAWSLHVRGYRVHIVITMRDWTAASSSQAEGRKHAYTLAHAWHKLQRAYREIFEAVKLLGVDYVICVYESLVLRPLPAARFLLASLGLEPTEAVSRLCAEITDQDAKWLEPEKQ